MLIAWQYFLRGAAERRRSRNSCRRSSNSSSRRAAQPGQPAPARRRSPGRRRCPASAAAPASRAESRAAALQASPRIPIKTASIQGSIALKGGRIDDVSLVKFHETVDPEIAADRAAVAFRQPRPVLRRVRLDRRRRHQRQAAQLRHAVDAGRRRRSHRRPSGDADLRQRRGPAIPPHRLGRRQLPVQHQGRGHQQERQRGLALSLRADLAPRHAADARLLRPARGPGRLSRQRRPAGIHLQEDAKTTEDRQIQRHRRLARHHRQIFGGRAGARHQGASEGGISTAKLGNLDTYQTDYLLDAKTVAPGASASADARLFAGAKEVAVLNAYEKRSTSTTSIC